MHSWEQDPNEVLTFTVPNDWKAGRIWVSLWHPGLHHHCMLTRGRIRRRQCDFSGPNPGPNSCIDGGCSGGLECDPHSGTVSFSKLDVRDISFILRTRVSLLLL